MASVLGGVCGKLESLLYGGQQQRKSDGDLSAE